MTLDPRHSEYIYQSIPRIKFNIAIHNQVSEPKHPEQELQVQFKPIENEIPRDMATAQILEPYDVHRFNTIPLLHDVSTSFQAKNGTEFVEKVFKPLVLKHKLESQLGIGLLHRHFDLEGFEKLVEFNNISSPWAIKAENHMRGKVLPCSWLINSGKLMPYEFFFAPGASEAEGGQGGDSGSGGGSGGGSSGGGGSGSGSDPRPVIDKALDLTESKFRAFLDELLPAMESHKLNDTLALRLFPGPDYAGGHEITHGRTNITLTPGQASTDSENFPFSSLRITQSKLFKEAETNSIIKSV